MYFSDAIQVNTLTKNAMKKILLTIILFISAVFRANSQDKASSISSPKGQELIIYMPYVDRAKTLQTVVDMVYRAKDINPVAFCDDLKCMLLRITSKHPEIAQRLLEDFKNAGFEFDIKSNGTIQQVLNQSHDILTEETYWQ